MNKKIFKKTAVMIGVCLLLLINAVPALAVLVVLEPELSAELREIAKAHIVQTENISGDTINIQDGWVREYFNVDVDVYMVTAVIDEGLATERTMQIPVRVDQKVVISDADLVALEEEDNALAPDEPVARILTAPDEEVVTDDLATAQPEQAEAAGYTLYYLAAGAVVLLLLGTTYILRRRRA